MTAGEAPPRAEKAAWQRFTILDLLLLFPAYAIAAAITRPLFNHPRSVHYSVIGYLSSVLIVTTLGSILAGPIILLAQVMVRKRRAMISAGEWVWLGPLPLSALMAIVTLLHFSREFWDILGLLAALFAFVSFISSLVALFLLLASVYGRRDVPCFWTDRLGIATAVAAGILAVILMAAIG
jgi:hypothetical protein